jgi:iron complex transport system ATP-binding protein
MSADRPSRDDVPTGADSPGRRDGPTRGGAAGAGAAPAALRLEGIAVELGGRTILSGIDFAIAPGEIVGLVGCNGVGKTTLLRVANGRVAPSAGRVRLGDDELARLSRRAVARRIALVPQDMHVPFPFRVGELVLMGRAPHQPLVGLESHHDVELAMRALARCGMEALADRDVTTLSGGERQLVLFARALVQEPSVLLLDEPTAFLDLRHRVEVLREVRAFARAGGAALVVSHDLSLAARSCDRIVLLEPGRVAAVGAPERVLTPDHLRRAFGIDALTFSGPDGALVVVPELEGEATGTASGSTGPC